MKKSVVYLALCGCLLSCKKDTVTTPLKAPVDEAKKYAVTFNVKDVFQHETETIKGMVLKDSPLQGTIRYLKYFVYAYDLTRYQQIEQDSTGRSVKNFEGIWHDPDNPPPDQISQETFGCIKDTLPPGNYTIIFVGVEDPDYVRDDFLMRFSSVNLLKRPFGSGSNEIFFKKFSITVGDEDIEQNVSLDRVVAKAEFHVKDAKPNTRFKFLFIDEYADYEFINEMPSRDRQDLRFENQFITIPGRPGFVHSQFVANTETPMNIIIKVFEGETLKASKTIEGVRFFRNKRTILTGNVYSDTRATSSFKVTVNDEFDSDTTVIEF